jgi:hypothetical protein
VFNCKLRSVEVSDTGIGMSADDLKEVLAPGKSLKRGTANLRGEKGVGVSFIVLPRIGSGLKRLTENKPRRSKLITRTTGFVAVNRKNRSSRT